ncbi:MAG: methyltransferase domain-containing protein [Dietzia sp.]|nr:methyltransferase domain-containing protein [Dietzia sp.]
MVRSNAEQELRAVQQAELGDGDLVLIVGHGPGVGVAAAAAAVAPTGHVIGVDPSSTMRDMARTRCASDISAGRVELRDGSAEQTGCAPASMDAAISVNNVMLWDAPVGFAELFRVLRPGGRLVIGVHRHVLAVQPEQLIEEAAAAGFADVTLSLRDRRFPSPAVEVSARRPQR